MKKLVISTGAALVLGVCLTLLPSSVKESNSGGKLASLAGDREERPEFPAEAAAYLEIFRQTPNGESPARLAYQASRELLARPSSRASFGASVPNLRIESFGPGNFGGRLRGIVIHPTDPSRMLVGSVSGGIWKTVDGGDSWVPANDFLPSLAIGSMLLDPDNPNRVWAGTGEGFFNVDAMRGMGIFRSDDFGDTWTHVAATGTSDFWYNNRLARRPGTNILMAATRTGIWRSTDLGASWTEVSGFAVSSRGFTDIKIDPSDITRYYAFHYGGSDASRRIFVSQNTGTTWAQIGAAEGLPTTDISRMEIGVGSDGVVYASVSNAANATRGLWRSAAGGVSWAQATSATAFIERQGWYDLPIGVDPSDSNRVLVGAVDLFRTTDAGTTITKQSFWNPGAGQLSQFVHADLHVVAFHPTTPSTVFIGSDGGIFKSTDSGDTWVGLDNDLRVTQYYGIAASPDGESVIGGTQDNGSHLFFGDKATWLQWFGGDGGFCAWDQQQPEFIYGATPFAGLFGSGDGGGTSAGLTLPASPGSLFITPFTIDSSNGNRMIVGTGTVLLSSNLRQLGTVTFTDVSGPIGGGSVSATTISPLDGAVSYVGKTTGDIWMTGGLGTGGAWTQIDDAAMPNTAVTWVEVDQADATGSTLYATFGGFGADRVWRTSNGGASWESIQGDLPQIPTFVVVPDPTDSSRLFLGSELGLWTTASNDPMTAGSSFVWQQYDYGVAFSRVQQLIWVGDDQMWIGTHGRGILRALRSPAEVSLGDIATTGCSGDTDAFIDSGETADVPVTVRNRGGLDMTAVAVSVATPYAGISVLTSAQALGTIAAGASETRTFQLEMGAFGACLDTAPLTATVTWGAEQAEALFDLQLSADPVVGTGTFTEDGEDAQTLMTSESAVGVDDWQRVTDQAATGIGSWFATDVPSYADKSLLSPWFEVGGATTVLSFALRYDMEGDGTQLWDGVVLEARTENGEWQDIGALSTVAYDGPLFKNNTIPGREAWSGTQLTWRNATVNLGADFNGETMQFRFRLVCDTGAANVGFWVDDIQLTNGTWLESLDCDMGCGPLFADGFEAGNTSAWSQTVP